MSDIAWMLELRHDEWRLHAKQGEACALETSAVFQEIELTDQANGIQQALESKGYRGEPIVLAVESCYCLSGTVTVDRPQELRDHRAMLFRLEESIPWSAEEFEADFVASGNSAFFVAISASPVAGLVNALSDRGINIQNVLPLAILVAMGAVSQVAVGGEATILIGQDSWIDVVVLRDNRPNCWGAMPSSFQAVLRHLDAIALERNGMGSIHAIGIDAAVVDRVKQDYSVSNSEGRGRQSVIELALSTAEKLIDGRIEAPIELKRGLLGKSNRATALRRQLAVLQMAMALLVVAAVAAMLYRGNVCARAAAEMSAKQTTVFQTVFPNSKVPTGIAARLRSELAKLKGLRGDDTSLPNVVSAISVFKGLLSAIPTDKRIQLLEIRIENGRLYLDGEARAHSDAELLTQRLRGQGFEAPSPRTQRLDDQRVSMRITAAYAGGKPLSPRGTK
jgi:hypothetical protein